VKWVDWQQRILKTKIFGNGFDGVRVGKEDDTTPFLRVKKFDNKLQYKVNDRDW
jgi:hypothetical protein